MVSDEKPSFNTGGGKPSSDGGVPNARSKRKTIIIAAFVAGFIGLAAYFGPLLVSSSALAMAGIDTVGQDFNAAREHLNLAISMNPHSAIAYQSRGLFYIQVQQPEKAIADFTKAIELGGGADSYFGRAYQYHQVGQFDNALKDYRICLEKFPLRKADIYTNEADIFFKQNKPHESIVACDKALAEDERNATARLNRAQAYIRLKRYQVAVEDLDKALDNTYRQLGNPDLKRDCYLMRSVAYRRLDDPNDADADLIDAKKAAHIKHNHASAGREFQNQFATMASRENFVLCSSYLNQTGTNAYADRIEAFMKFINANLAHVRSNKSLHIYCFADKTKFQEFGKGKSLFNEQPSETENDDALIDAHNSRYDADKDSLFSFAPPDVEGIIYTLSQKIIRDQPFGDKWAGPGFAALLAKCYGFASASDCELCLAQNLQCYSLKPDFIVPPLVQVINNSRQGPDDQTAVLAALFLLKKGKMQKYFELIKSGDDGDYPSAFEAACDKRAPDLEGEWQTFIKELKSAGTPLAPLPKPEIFTSKQEFEKFEKMHPELQLTSLKKSK